MPRPVTPTPTEEWPTILRVLWQLGPSTVRQIHDALNDHPRTGHARGTITPSMPAILAVVGLLIVSIGLSASAQTGSEQPAKVASEYAAKIKTILPKGWSVGVEKKVITVRRDDEIEAFDHSPIAPLMISARSYTVVIQVQVGPRISMEQYGRMVEENMKARQEALAKHPNYDPIDNPISRRLPHSLPTHFNEQHSLWISSRLLD